MNSLYPIVFCKIDLSILVWDSGSQMLSFLKLHFSPKHLCIIAFIDLSHNNWADAYLQGHNYFNSISNHWCLIKQRSVDKLHMIKNSSHSMRKKICTIYRQGLRMCAIKIWILPSPLYTSKFPGDPWPTYLASLRYRVKARIVDDL